jgi:hypothetical protein
VDIRRIDLMPRSLERQRPWQHKRIRHALAIGVFVFPNLVLSLALVPASHATRTNVHNPKLASFVKHPHRAIELPRPEPGVPLTAPTVAALPVIAPPDTVPAPAIPAPTPAPAVDSSSAAAWAASPGVACIREDESGDNYSTDTGNGYYGAYQDTLSTWDSHGGTGLPSDAPPAVQDQINYEIWLSGGWGQWGTSGGCGL